MGRNVLRIFIDTAIIPAAELFLPLAGTVHYGQHSFAGLHYSPGTVHHLF
jgi:hypothetical protein